MLKVFKNVLYFLIALILIITTISCWEEKDDILSPTNSSPQWTSSSYQDSCMRGDTLIKDLSLLVTDINEDSLIFTIVGTIGIIDSGSIFKLIAPTNSDSLYNIDIIVSDGFLLDTTSFEIKIYGEIIKNNQPKWSDSVYNYTAIRGVPFLVNLSLLSSDIDEKSILTYLILGTKSGLDTINDSLYSITALNSTISPYIVKLAVFDGELYDTAIFNFTLDSLDTTVQDAPLFSTNTITTLGNPVQDSSLKLLTSLSKGSMPMNYYWYKNNSLIDSNISAYTYTDTISFDPLSLNDSGAYQCIVKNQYGSDTTDIYTLKVAVNDTSSNENHKPVFVSGKPLQQYSINEGDTLKFEFEATDEDGDSVIYIIDYDTLPRSETAIINTGTFIWCSQLNDRGNYNISMSALDGIDTTKMNIVIGVGDVNLPPLITIEGFADSSNIIISEKDTISFTVEVTDMNLSDSPSLIPITGLPDSCSYTIVNEIGTFNFVPDYHMVSISDSVKTFPFTFLATDNVENPAYDTLTLFISVLNSNRVPICNDTSMTVNETVGENVNINATDSDGDPLTWKIINTSTKGTVSSLAGDVTSAEFEYVYTANNFKEDVVDTLLVETSDGKNACTSSVIIKINATDNAPVIIGQKLTAIDEDMEYTLNDSDIVINDDDSEAHSLIVLPGQNYSIVSGTTIKPEENYLDTISVYVKVNDGKSESNTYLLKLAITPLNDVPRITGQKARSTLEDTAYVIKKEDLYVDDPDNSDFEIIVLSGTDYTFTDSTITPALNFFGDLFVNIRVTDNIDTSAITTFKISVLSQNDLPVIKISEPTPGRVIDFGQQFSIPITIDDPEGIKRVYVYIDGYTAESIEEDLESFTFYWGDEYSDKLIGDHVLRVSVTDSSNEYVSDTISVTINGTWESDSIVLQKILDINTIVPTMAPPGIDVNTFATKGSNNRCISFNFNGSHYAGLNEVPTDIRNLSELKSLKITTTYVLADLPTEIGDLANLDTLDLSSSYELSSLPYSIRDLKKLKYLNLRETKISNLTRSIGELESLEILNLYNINLGGGGLDSLPSTIGDLNNLKNLNISGCKLNKLPSSMKELANIETISASYNNLTELPFSSGNLPKLTGINEGTFTQNKLNPTGNPAWALWLDEKAGSRANWYNASNQN